MVEKKLYNVAEAPLKAVVDMADGFIKVYGVTSDIEVSIVLGHIGNDGRGIPFTKWCNSRNYNQSYAIQFLKDEGYITENKIVTPKCTHLIDGGRDDIEYYSDFTLYNTNDGRLYINTKSPNIGRITGEFTGLEEGYNDEFRSCSKVTNKNILSSRKQITMAFPDLKFEYRPTEKSSDTND